MTGWTTVAIALAAVNLTLLGTLIAVWLSNYRTFRTVLVLGLLLFAVVMAIENVVAIWAYLTTGMLYAGGTWTTYAALTLRALQFLALVFLAITTHQ